MSNFFNFSVLVEKAPLFVWIYLVVIFAVAVDLVTALHYAKASGIPIVSGRLRHTVDKVVRYYGVLMMGTSIDVILYLCSVYEQLNLFTAPYGTAFFAILLCSIEVKSVFEHRDPRRRKLLRKAGESILSSLSQRDLHLLFDFLSTNKEEGEAQQQAEQTLHKTHRRRANHKRKRKNNGQQGNKEQAPEGAKE